MTMNFAEKTVLITGATRGLGAKIAEHFWHAGANLILVSRTQSMLEKLREQLFLTKMLNQTIKIFSVDLSVAAQTEKFIQHIPQKKIDVLINNAAIQGPIGPVWENDWEKWQAALQVNLLSPVMLCRAIVPNMLQQYSGKIINLSGGGAANVRPNFSAYAVAKAGLVRFSEILAEEVKGHNIDVNCIAPGVMNTELLSEIVMAGKEKTGEIEFQQAQQKILNNENSFDRAVALCLFLASAQSNGVTGKLISAVWDPWHTLPTYINEIKNSDIYTLRRITPRDRDKSWGDI